MIARNRESDFSGPPRTCEVSRISAEFHHRIDRLQRSICIAVAMVPVALVAAYALGRVHGDAQNAAMAAPLMLPAAGLDATPQAAPTPPAPTDPQAPVAAPSAPTTPPAADEPASSAATSPTQDAEAPAPAEEAATPPAIVCSSFRLVDATGKDRVAIGVGPDGAAHIVVLDTQGHKRLSFHAESTDESSLRIFSADETPRLVLGNSQGGDAGIDITDKEGRTRVTLMATDDGDSLIGQADAKETERISHRVTADGGTASAWFDANHNFRVVAGVFEKSGGFVDVLDAKEQVRSRTFADDKGRSGTIHRDFGGKDRLFLGCEAEAWSGMSWLDAMGKLRLMAATLEDTVLAPNHDLINATEPDWAEKNGAK